MFLAKWKGAEIARAPACISVEKAHYFPADTVSHAHLIASEETSVCEWKGGRAAYFDIRVGDEINPAAVWSYPSTQGRARVIEGWFAFRRGVEIAWVGDGPEQLTILEPAMPNVAKALGGQTVEWRPALPFAHPGGPFQGYLITDLGVLVDVLSDPGPEARGAIIASARELAGRVAAWSALERAQGRPGLAYIAVWGSTPPDAAAVAALRAGKACLALASELEIVG
jgi:uncharacterized protein (DUF427 family)